MTDMERRAPAAQFAADWQGRGDEKQETSLFWIALLQFDIVYSAKIGYVKLQAPYPRDETPEVVNTPEDLLDALFLEIINDVMFSPDNPRRGHNDSAMTRHEKMECRCRIAAILETMEDGDRARCLDFMETYIGEYPESSAQFGRE